MLRFFTPFVSKASQKNTYHPNIPSFFTPFASKGIQKSAYHSYSSEEMDRKTIKDAFKMLGLPENAKITGPMKVVDNPKPGDVNVISEEAYERILKNASPQENISSTRDPMPVWY